MRREQVYTGLKGKYMNTQMRIVLHAGRGVKRKIHIMTANHQMTSHQKVKEIPAYQAFDEFVLTGWEF